MPKAHTELTPYINATAAMVIYGGWAVFANFEHGRAAWLTAGVIQGFYAFASTLTVTVIAKKAFFKFGCGTKGLLLGFLTSFFIMLLFPLTIHTVAGTPDIIETITPGLIWGSGYLAIYLYLTQRNLAHCSK